MKPLQIKYSISFKVCKYNISNTKYKSTFLLMKKCLFKYYLTVAEICTKNFATSCIKHAIQC